MQNVIPLRNLMLMARADGKIDEAEMQLLQSHRRKWGVSESQFAELLEETSSDEATIQVPESPSLRHDLLADMAVMMAADGQVDEMEMSLLRNAARRMGVHDEQLNEILEDFTDGDDDLVLGEE